MPSIARFEGIAIYMYYNDHPPHRTFMLVSRVIRWK